MIIHKDDPAKFGYKSNNMKKLKDPSIYIRQVDECAHIDGQPSRGCLLPGV
jgi:hypothetical protein